jgi:hypothetical protein
LAGKVKEALFELRAETGSPSSWSMDNKISLTFIHSTGDPTQDLPYARQMFYH